MIDRSVCVSLIALRNAESLICPELSRRFAVTEWTRSTSQLSAVVTLKDIWSAGLGFAATLVIDVIATEDIGSRRTGIAA